MPKNSEKTAMWVTEKAKDTTIVDSEIEGLKNEGVNTQVFHSKIFNYRKSHPGIWRTAVTGIIIAVIAGIILLLIEYNIFV